MLLDSSHITSYFIIFHCNCVSIMCRFQDIITCLCPMVIRDVKQLLSGLFVPRLSLSGAQKVHTVTKGSRSTCSMDLLFPGTYISWHFHSRRSKVPKNIWSLLIKQCRLQVTISFRLDQVNNAGLV